MFPFSPVFQVLKKEHQNLKIGWELLVPENIFAISKLAAETFMNLI